MAPPPNAEAPSLFPLILTFSKPKFFTFAVLKKELSAEKFDITYPLPSKLTQAAYT